MRLRRRSEASATTLKSHRDVAEMWMQAYRVDVVGLGLGDDHASAVRRHHRQQGGAQVIDLHLEVLDLCEVATQIANGERAFSEICGLNIRGYACSWVSWTIGMDEDVHIPSSLSCRMSFWMHEKGIDSACFIRSSA
jgi:hypothetical protein